MQPLQGQEQAMFKDLCSVIDKQTITKLLTGHIDSVISPIQKDPLAGK
jgi:hypothetical protein